MRSHGIGGREGHGSKNHIFNKAEEFIERVTFWNKKSYAKFVKNLFPGDENGKKTGIMCFIAVKDVEETKVKKKIDIFYIKISYPDP